MKKILAGVLSALMVATTLPCASLAADLGSKTTTTYFDFDCSELPSGMKDLGSSTIDDGKLSMPVGTHAYYEMGESRGERKGLDSGVITIEFDTAQTDWRNDPIFSAYYLYDIDGGWGCNNSIDLFTQGGNGNMYWRYVDANGTTQTVDSGSSWNNKPHVTVKIDVDNNTAECVLESTVVAGFSTTRTLQLNDVQYVYRADFVAQACADTFDNMKCYKTVDVAGDSNLNAYFNFDCSELPSGMKDLGSSTIADGKLSMPVGTHAYYEIGESRGERKGLDSGVIYFEFDTKQSDWRNDPIFSAYYLYDIEGGWGCNNSIDLFTQGGNGNMYWRYVDANGTTQTFDSGFDWGHNTHAMVAIDVDNDAAVCTLTDIDDTSSVRSFTFGLNDVQYVYRADFVAQGCADTFDNLQCYKKVVGDATFTVKDYGAINDKNGDRAGIYYIVKVNKVSDELTINFGSDDFTISDLGDFDIATTLSYVIIGTKAASGDIHSVKKVTSGGTSYVKE